MVAAGQRLRLGRWVAGGQFRDVWVRPQRIVSSEMRAASRWTYRGAAPLPLSGRKPRGSWSRHFSRATIRPAATAPWVRHRGVMTNHPAIHQPVPPEITKRMLVRDHEPFSRPGAVVTRCHRRCFASKQRLLPPGKNCTTRCGAREETARAVPRCTGMMSAAIRRAALLAAMSLALPVTCSQSGDGTFAGGIQPSPAGRVNPAEPGFANGGGGGRY